MSPTVPSIRIPTWAIAILVGLGITLAGGFVKWGQASQRMDSLDSQLSAMVLKQDKDMSEMREQMRKIYDLLLAMNNK